MAYRSRSRGSRARSTGRRTTASRRVYGQRRSRSGGGNRQRAQIVKLVIEHGTSNPVGRPVLASGQLTKAVATRVAMF